MARNGNGKNGNVHRVIAYRRRRRNGNHTSRWVYAAMVFASMGVIVLAVFAAVGYTVYRSYADDLTPPDEAIAKLPRGGATILDRNGNVMYQYVDDVSGVREPVTKDQMSLYLVLATVDTEDSSFFTNPGVNYQGLAAAAIDNLWPFGKSPGVFEGRGGSSITQQLVKNVYFPPEERSKRSVDRKVKETVLALELTNKYPKDQILMWYLNLISYGNIYNGAQAAAKGYFGKDVKDLSLAEAATLAGIPASPSLYDPVNNPQAALDRRNYVLSRMHEEGDISDAQLWEAATTPLQTVKQSFPVEAPHFVFNVVEPELQALFGDQSVKQDGLVVYTTLDLNLQHRTQEIAEEQTQTYEYSGGHNIAVVGMDPKTGQVLTYMGSRDYFNEGIQGQNDMADSGNSPGSTLKPITYVTAFMKLGWGPGHLIIDSPIPSKYWDGKNPPRNPVPHSGPITARNALGNSLNIPAIKTILSVGVDPVIEQAKKQGITTLDGKQLGPSMTVGGVDVKLSDMVYAYTAFPNLGIQRGIESAVNRPLGNRELDPISILRVEDREGNVLYPIVDGAPAQEPRPQEVRVADAPEAYMINNILSDPQAFCLTYGCGGLSLPGRPAAFKTGTSEPYETIGLIGDTWTFGYTPQIVVGTWFGNADNTPMHNIAGANAAYHTVRDVMAEYLKDKPVEEFVRPEGLVNGSVCIPSGMKVTPTCPNTTPNDLLDAAKVPQEDDNWWTVANIDRRTGKLASNLTPAQFVVTRRYLNVPDNLPEFLREEALAWQSMLGGGGTAPTETTTEADIPAAINHPANGASVAGVVSISGRASSPNFTSYKLEYVGSGGREQIMQSTTPVSDGVLGVWDTSGLDPGLYQLVLTVTDAQLGDRSYAISLVVADVAQQPPTPADNGNGEGNGGGRRRGRD